VTTTTKSSPDTTLQNADIAAAVNSATKKYGADGIQVAVIKNGLIVGEYQCGYAVKKTAPMTADTKIRIASISKVVLTMTVMKLVETGQLDIDKSLSEYYGVPVKNNKYPSIPITMRQILTHTSSIKLYAYENSTGDIVRKRFANGSAFTGSKPGDFAAWRYNNYAFAALGVLVEITQNETINNIAKRELFAPLGIDAGFGGGNVADKANIASLPSLSADKQRAIMGSTTPGERGDEFPGGLVVSATDLAKLIAALANDGVYDGIRVLSASTVAEIETMQGAAIENGQKFSQCLTLRRRTDTYGQNVLYYHTGSKYGAYNFISYNPDTKDGIVVLTTGASGTKDEYGIYAVCGDIARAVYSR
jgi:CubicO group peptidase (beta-lactamase class C family)